MTKQQILDDAYAQAKTDFIPVMGEECRAVLRKILIERQPKRILEIGSAVGYSSSIMLEQLSDAHVDTIEIDFARAERARALWRNLGFEPRVTLYLGDVNEILERVTEGKTYDFVLIDGPKSGYLNHLRIVLPHLAVGGIILADDVNYLGLVEGDTYPPHKHRTIVTRMRAFLDEVTTRDDLHTELLLSGNGIAVIRKLR